MAEEGENHGVRKQRWVLDEGNKVILEENCKRYDCQWLLLFVNTRWDPEFSKISSDVEEGSDCECLVLGITHCSLSSLMYTAKL